MGIRSFARQKLARWEQKTAAVLAIAGLLYLAIYSLQVIFYANEGLQQTLNTAAIVIWCIFAADLAVRVLLASSWKAFLKASWLEIIALAIPFMRILRIFRIVVAVRGLRPFLKTRMAATGTYILMLLPLTWFAGAIGALDAEQGSIDAKITTLPDALWWSLTTLTTVGYGDLYPVTFEGKLIAALLMLMGIALFSAGAGMFGSWIIGETKQTATATVEPKEGIE